MKRAKVFLICIALIVPIAGIVASPAKAAGGPVVLMGIDAEDGNQFGAHGGIGPYASVVTDLLSNTSNGGDGILAVGSGKGGDDVTTFWNNLGAAVGEIVTHVNGAAISGQSLAGFQVVGVASSFCQSFAGLDQSENDLLAARQNDIATHVNGGGGLIGFSQECMTNPYAYISAVGGFTFAFPPQYLDVEATPEGEAVGITDTNMDVCCWHDEILTFPSFLSVLAINVETGNAAAVGGAEVVVPTNISLTPATAENPTGTSHTVTATILDANGVPQVGVPVTFSISGPNAAATGVCSPADCTTDSDGKVTFTYTGTAAGTDTITASFVDGQGATQTATAEKNWIIVNEPPDCSGATASAETWPPNHRMESVSINGVTDPDGDPVTVTATSVKQDEPVPGPGKKHAPDAQLDPLQIRVERDGGGDGRVYVIAFTATDPSNASCSGTVEVSIPHDQSGDAAVNSGATHDSTVA